MARWILYRDMGEQRRPCEVARCDAPDWYRAVETLARFAGDRAQITERPHVATCRARTYYVQSVASVAEDAASRRLRESAMPKVPQVRRPPETSA